MEKSVHNLPFNVPIQQKLVVSTRQKIAFIASITLVVLLQIVTISKLEQLRECNRQQMNANRISDKEKEMMNSNHSHDHLQIMSRFDWLAIPAKTSLSDLNLPVSRVIIAHTVSDGCFTPAECAFRVRDIQKFHMETRGWDDIAYNFLIGGDGHVYEGRGFDKYGACVKGFNIDSICIAFIGTFTNVAPTNRQLEIAQQLLLDGIKLNKLKSDYRLYGHRQLATTESPGEKLYNIIKNWEHWQATPVAT